MVSFTSTTVAIIASASVFQGVFAIAPILGLLGGGSKRDIEVRGTETLLSRDLTADFNTCLKTAAKPETMKIVTVTPTSFKFAPVDGSFPEACHTVAASYMKSTMLDGALTDNKDGSYTIHPKTADKIAALKKVAVAA